MAAPPEPGADGGAPAPAPTPAPAELGTMAKSYKEKYSIMEDVMQGSYQRFYQARSIASGATAAQLYNKATSSNNRVPKVYLFLSDVRGKPMISTFHRPWRYQEDEIESAPWDGNTYGFLGDVDAEGGGAFIATRELPAEAFDETPEQRVPTVASMDALVEALGPEDYFIDSPAAPTANNRLISTRNFMPLPPIYVEEYLNLRAPPATWWKKLGGKIRDDEKETELAEVLNWLCICLTKQAQPEQDDESEEEAEEPVPGPHMGERDSFLPPLAEDRNFNKHRLEILRTDLPGLCSSNITTTGSGDPTLLGVVQTMREEGKLDRELRKLELLERKQKEATKKKPSYVFPSSYTHWMQVCMVVDEDDLEPFYIQWAETKPGYRRKELQARVNTRATEAGAAGKRPPIVMKELFEMVTDGELGSCDTPLCVAYQCLLVPGKGQQE